MIANNYNNSLKENTETGMTFYSPVSPVVVVRAFDFNLTRGETRLVIPFYVSDGMQKEYRDCKIGPTFTTIIRLDEDTVPDEDVVEWKRTTYAGEHVADLGVFTKEGIHSFSIRTIQSNGVGSATKYYRFIVRKPKSEMVVLNLDNEDSFTGSFSNRIWIDAALDSGPAIAIRNESNAGYYVEVDRSSGDYPEITITVTNGTVNRYRTNADGSRYNLFGAKDISGVYRLTQFCTIGNKTVKLSDYLDVDSSDIPQEVTLAAARNKVALTRLFEAAKAYGADILKLPEAMLITLSHLNASGTDVHDTFTGKDDVVFPDGLTVDLNKSTVRVLRTSMLQNGTLFHIQFNTDTHLVNGSVVGNWKHYKFNKKTSSSYIEGETVHNISVHSSLFSSVEDMDISYSLGYELHVGNVGASPSRVESEYRKFDKFGFIDYEGVVHEDSGSVHVDGVGDVARTSGLMYTSGYRDLETRNVPLYGHTLIIRRYTTEIKQVHRLSRREMFVHYYDQDYTFIKTVKVLERWPLIWPYNAKYARLTIYGDNGFSGSESLNRNSNYGRFGVDCRSQSWGSGVYRCKVHDTRSCLLDNGGIQTVTDSCLFWNISGERYGLSTWYSGDNYYATKLLSDVEDDMFNLYNYSVRNCEFLYGDVRAFSFVHGYDTDISGCCNISFIYHYHAVGGMVHDSCCGVAKHNGYPTNNPQIMVTNNILQSMSSDLSDSNPGSATPDIWLGYNYRYTYTSQESIPEHWHINEQYGR